METLDCRILAGLAQHSHFEGAFAESSCGPFPVLSSCDHLQCPSLPTSRLGPLQNRHSLLAMASDSKPFCCKVSVIVCLLHLLYFRGDAVATFDAILGETSCLECYSSHQAYPSIIAAYDRIGCINVTVKPKLDPGTHHCSVRSQLWTEKLEHCGVGNLARAASC